MRDSRQTMQMMPVWERILRCDGCGKEVVIEPEHRPMDEMGRPMAWLDSEVLPPGWIRFHANKKIDAQEMSTYQADVCSDDCMGTVVAYAAQFFRGEGDALREQQVQRRTMSQVVKQAVQEAEQIAPFAEGWGQEAEPKQTRVVEEGWSVETEG